MCGIAGAVGLHEPPSESRRRAVLDGIRHRGPDAEGDRYRAGRWLGFRRLSILDLSRRADQPMVDDATDAAIAFNGEVYDYIERRRELEAKGHRFTTSGDTEVMLRGYLEWGEEVFSRCNGMWAVAIDDPQRPGLLLARDRFGEKPLHIGRHPDGSWWFASEVRPLVAIGVGEHRLDLDRAFAFLAVGDIEDPAGSYVAGIEQLPPGTLATLGEDGLSTPRAWFDLDAFVAEAVDRRPPGDEEVRDALDRAVGLRLRSDVTVGTSLSGGVDSSAVVASLRTVDPDRTVHAFTASFPGRSIDEWERAAMVAERFAVELHRVEPTPRGFAADLDELVAHQGAPIESPTVYAQWCVMRRAHDEGVTVLLDGQGADETWGGYPKHVGFALAHGVASGHLASVATMVRSWRRLGGRPPAALSQLLGLAAPDVVRRRMLGVLAGRRRASLGPAFDAAGLGDVVRPGRGPVLVRAARSDLGRVVLPRLLRYADRNSMAWGREVRLPFLDPELAAMGLASGWFDGMADGWTKRALRRAVDPRLPAEVTWRREKTAYEVPVGEWLEHPAIDAAVVAGRGRLVELGIVAPTAGDDLDPWRTLSLARLIDLYGLTP